MRLLGRRFPIIVILVLAVGCQSPVGSASAKTGPGSLIVSFATEARTVVAAGLASTISMYAVHMTCPGQTTIDQTTLGTNSSMTVTSVGAGTWDITVTATSGAGIVGVGNGTVTVTVGSAAATTVSLSTTQSGGKGNYSYTFAVPTSVGITSVTAQRYTSGYVAVSGAAFTPTMAPGTGALSTDTVGTVAETNVTSGTYLLRLTFWRGSQPVGTFVEAVNVWDNVTSDQWLDTTGTPRAYQLYAATSFASSNAFLETLPVTGASLLQYPAFGSAVTTYLVSTTDTVVLAPTTSVTGQALRYRVDSGPWVPLASGTSTEPVGPGHSMTVRVTAQDGSSKDYTVTIIGQATTVLSVSMKSYGALSLRSPATLMVGQSFTFMPSFSGATNWNWTLNGATVSNVATYLFAPSSAGHYVICATATLDGVLYSGSVSVAVTDQGIVMLAVPGGTFSRDGTGTNLSVVSPFLMSQFDITQDQYQIVMGNNPSNLTGNGLRPVEMVSWYQALFFCNSLSLEQGLTPVYTINGSTNPAAWGTVPTVSSTTWNAAIMDRNASGYRLPTEMEWVWAAMGATSNTGYTSATGYSKAFAGSNGSNSAGDYAWGSANSTSTTHPVGTKLPNELGLYDMSGNVWQRCWDWFGGTSASLSWSGTLTDYAGRPSGSSRAMFGGSWVDAAAAMAVANRNGTIAPSDLRNNVGFRVVRSNGGQYVPTNGLVGQWMLDGNVLDTSGSNPTSPYNGTTSSTSSTIDRKGNTGGALIFPGTSAVTVSNSSSFPFGLSHPFSLSIWLNPTSGAGNVVGTLGTTGTIQVSISLEAVDATRCNVFSWIGSDSSGGNRSSSSITLGTWHHAVLVFNGTKMTTYVDGVFVGSINSTYGSYPVPGTDFYIGTPYVGSLASCRLYNRALTAAEVTALYQE